jgi:hypothetical protein
MSIVLPRCFNAMAEHSICHPGRPFPQGLSHIGKSDENFHNAKSKGSFLRGSTSILTPDSILLLFFFDNFPY